MIAGMLNKTTNTYIWARLMNNLLTLQNVVFHKKHFKISLKNDDHFVSASMG